MGFAQNLEYLMQMKAMSRYQLAKEIGCHQTSVANWLKNGTMPQKRTIEAVASVFGISSIELCGDDLPQSMQKKTPTAESGERITFDDFTYAMQHEAKDLTDMDKQLLLSMAKQLNDARKQKDGERK